jgi:NitT/TauT family transport system ATP-binding protein
VIIEADLVTKTFTTPDGRALPVLDDVSFALHEGEIVALLGKSGSGKSTLLRCIAGLIAPSSGTVTYRGTPLNGANPGVAMVFQSFALLPWLTVQQNVELAMQAREVPEEARRDKALRAIDLIGLDGFESAYPKELSGGMRQRVGFARALSVEPNALLMDEPFSALDVLTAANLRGELTRLWEGHEFPVKAVLIVTHNIEEAVQLADRILVLSSNPGRIRAELPCRLPRPRERHDPAFEQLVDTVYGILTGREEAAEQAVTEVTTEGTVGTPVDTPLPDVSVGGLSGLLEILVAKGGAEGLADLSDDLSFEIDDLLPLVDAAVMLGLAQVHEARLEITEQGREFVTADIDTSKKLFGELISARAPLIKAILRGLRATGDGTLREGFFLDLLRRGFSAEGPAASLTSPSTGDATASCSSTRRNPASWSSAPTRLKLGRDGDTTPGRRVELPARRAGAVQRRAQALPVPHRRAGPVRRLGALLPGDGDRARHAARADPADHRRPPGQPRRHRGPHGFDDGASAARTPGRVRVQGQVAELRHSLHPAAPRRRAARRGLGPGPVRRAGAGGVPAAGRRGRGPTVRHRAAGGVRRTDLRRGPVAGVVFRCLGTARPRGFSRPAQAAAAGA